MIAGSKRDFAIQAQPIQVDREVQATEGFGTFVEYFTEFKEGVISKQEKSFVNALDNFSKVHSNIADLQAQIQKLSKEKEDLLKQKQKSTLPTPQKVQQNCRCKELQLKTEEYSKETESLKQKCFKVNLDKEVETSKLQGTTAILTKKIVSATTQTNILNQDINIMEKRLTSRNETILELEDRIKAQNSEILKLQDEIFSWNLHASRSDDTLLSPDDSSDMQEKETEEPTHSADENNNSQKKETVKGKKQNKEKTEDNSQKKDNTEQNAQKEKAKEAEDTIDLTDEMERKTRVLLVGTSNLKFISTQQLSDKMVKVDKVIKYTLDEARST